MARPRRPRGRERRRERRRGQRPRRERRGGRRADGGPIDAERVVALLGRQRGGLPAERLLRALGRDRRAGRGLRRVLRRLEEEGRVQRARGVWRVPRADGLVEGELLDSRRGEGASVRDDRGRLYRVRDLGGGQIGDRVLIAPRGERGAELLHVVAGHRDRWVGILRRHGRLYGLAPYRDDGEWWIRVARDDTGGAHEGEVVVALPREGGRDGSPWARVVERLGRPGDPDADFAAVTWRHRLPVDFPPEVLAQAEALRPPREGELTRRVDLRERPFVTIDPATARDHDDAVCVERLAEGWRLQVAIADVSHWVAADSAIDREALRRGNSVYFPDRAIPMLPERLSGDVCSLRPDADRLVLAVELCFDGAGRVTRRGFYPAVIRSRARLAYAQAAGAMERGEDELAQAPMLRELGRLATALGRRRRAGGSLDFELPAPRFELDDAGRPLDVQPEPRTAAHRAIEEAMLAANRAVAELLVEADVPAVHRVHDPPSPKDMEALTTELTALGLMDGGAPGALGPRELRQALERASRGSAEGVRRYVHQLALRSMQKARYAPRSSLHYALNFEHYLHFTSPIRRYADLAVHRVLKAWIAEREDALDADGAAAIAQRVSFRERLTLAAEREMDDIKTCVFLRDHLGEEHEGTVTSVAPHGLYVALDAWMVEGLVHVSQLPGRFELDGDGRALVSRRQRYTLGQRLRVRIVRADPVAARIDFELAGGGSPKPRRR